MAAYDPLRLTVYRKARPGLEKPVMVADMPAPMYMGGVCRIGVTINDVSHDLPLRERISTQGGLTIVIDVPDWEEPRLTSFEHFLDQEIGV